MPNEITTSNKQDFSVTLTEKLNSVSEALPKDFKR